MDKNEQIFIVTDSCMWENNKQNKTNYPHSIQVVDSNTGQVRYIRSGARIVLIEGQITEAHSQEQYNEEKNSLPSRGKSKLQRSGSKKCIAKKDKSQPKNKSV